MIEKNTNHLLEKKLNSHPKNSFFLIQHENVITFIIEIELISIFGLI